MLSYRPGDTQQVELLGRNRLIDELLRDNLEIALPMRDRGVDLIAYIDSGEGIAGFAATPIQMKASWKESFGIDRKYMKFPRLLIAFVWHLDDRERAETFALTFSEVLSVAETMGWTKTKSWENGLYIANRPSPKLNRLLQDFRMTPGKWRKRLLSV